MEIDKKSIEWKAAKALVFLDLELLCMGDSYEELVECICNDADISLSSKRDFNFDFLKKMHKKAYYIILQYGAMETLANNLTYYLENKECLVKYLVHYDKKEISKNPIVKAVNTLRDYVAYLNEKGSCSKVVLNLALELAKDFDKMNLKAILLGRKFSYAFYKELDDKLFYRSNDVFTIGEVMYKSDKESSLGDYVCHASLKDSSNGGYSIAFSESKSKYYAKIYEYKKHYGPFSMEITDTGVSYEIVDEESFVSDLVAKINDLGSKKALTA